MGEESGEAVEATQESGKLGFVTILLITINSIMGTGIFFLPAVGAREAGLFSIISWIIMGLIAIYFSMIFAELVGIFPKEGGVYEYAKEAFGQFPSFILGWMTLVAAYVTIAMLIVGAILYVAPTLPSLFTILISITFILAFNFMAFKGLKTGAVMLVAFALITLVAVFGIMVPGLIHFNSANFIDWFSHAKFTGLDGVGGFFTGLSVVFVTIFFIAETFFGWETTTFLAEKVRNPKRVMPKVMIIATIFIAICSLLFVISSFSLISWQTFAQSATPLADLAGVIYGPQSTSFYGLLVYLAIIGSVAGWIVASPNLIVALAKDKMFIPQLAQLHPKTKTPYKAIIFQTILTSLLVIVGAGNYETLLHLLVPLVLFLYSAVVLSLLVIRRKYPKAEKYYTAPFGSWGPILLMTFTLGLVILWATHSADALSTLSLLGSFILFGFPIYLLLVLYYDPQASLKFQNETAWVSFLLDRLFFPKSIQKKFLANAQIEGKVVLELGASSGLVSVEVAKRRPKKQIIIEHTESAKKFIEKKLRYRENVVVLKDELLRSRIHPQVDEVDEVISFGILGDLHNEQQYLAQLAHILPQHARIHFFDYVDLYKFIPNKEIVDDLDRLKEIFRRAGFAVHITKHKGTFWNYLIIDGIRSDNTDTVYV
ncbi:MAG: amino acid permease [Nanoarchaeota archaeon]|nr:amino acid permease [Nanoarchaeota archaeon]